MNQWYLRQDVEIIKTCDVGRIVWGKLGAEHHWPAIIIDHSECNLPVIESNGLTWVYWFGDNRVSKAATSKMKDFLPNFERYFIKSRNKNFRPGVKDCIKECIHKGNISNINTESFDQLLNFALNFNKGGEIFLPERDTGHSVYLKKCLTRMCKVMSRDDSSVSDCFPTSSSSSDTDSDSEERRHWKAKASLFKDVKRGNLDIETLCIACDRTGLPVVAQHPLFYGGLCTYCKEEVYDCLNVDGDSDLSGLCCICASPGVILLCDAPHCSKVFCVGCVELLVGPRAVENIQDTDPWWCFLCDQYQPTSHNLIKPRPNWKINIKTCALIDSQSKEIYNNGLPTPQTLLKKEGIKVLSLFDGISTGMLVLDLLDIPVKEYYSSEVDEDAINVSKYNFHKRIHYLGDVAELSEEKILELCPIDLLIGGSPCNDLSFVNPQRKGLFDSEGSGILFFHFFRIQKIIQAGNIASNTHLFWLFENVAAMSRGYKNYISKFLQCHPVVIDAKDFSPQCRQRCFWGNIPGMDRTPPTDKNVDLEQCLIKECERIARTPKINCVTTNTNSLVMKGCKWPIKMNNSDDVPWITELERIFGFPQHYTDVGNLSSRERQVLLGRSWSVPVICHLLEPLRNLLILKDDISEYEAHTTSGLLSPASSIHDDECNYTWLNEAVNINENTFNADTNVHCSETFYKICNSNFDNNTYFDYL